MGLTKYEVLKLMEQIGGSFDSNLAKAWQKADLENDRRLMLGFGDLYKRYEDICREKYERAKAQAVAD